MKTTNRVKSFIRLRNIVVAALLVILLTLAGCAELVTPAPGMTDEPAAEVTAPQTLQPQASDSAEQTAPQTQLPQATSGVQTAAPVASTAKPAATAAPTAKLTAAPTAKLTAAPTAKPTAAPTAAPTVKPTAAPTSKPTAAPTAKPTAAPTAKPTAAPTAKPTAAPTSKATNPLFGNFSAKDVKGNTVTNSIFAGQEVTMVNIWASYCGPCVKELPDLAALNDTYASRGFRVVGIILDASNSKGTVDDAALSDAKDIIAKTGADFTHIVPSASMFSAYLKNVSSVPTTVFVNSDGEIIGSAYAGSKSESQWAKIIEDKLG